MGSRALSLFFTPQASHTAPSLSAHWVMNSASAKLTSSSAAARYSRMLVSMRMKVREAWPSRRASCSARSQ